MFVCAKVGPGYTVELDPVIQSQLETRDEVDGLMWCKFGHVTAR